MRTIIAASLALAFGAAQAGTLSYEVDLSFSARIDEYIPPPICSICTPVAVASGSILTGHLFGGADDIRGLFLSANGSYSLNGLSIQVPGDAHSMAFIGSGHFDASRNGFVPNLITTGAGTINSKGLSIFGSGASFAFPMPEGEATYSLDDFSITDFYLLGPSFDVSGWATTLTELELSIRAFTPMAAGQVPEPAGWLLVLTGLVAMRRWT